MCFIIFYLTFPRKVVSNTNSDAFTVVSRICLICFINIYFCDIDYQMGYDPKDAAARVSVLFFR